MENTDHSRWFHPSMYLYSDSGTTPMVANNASSHVLSSQPYSTTSTTTDGSEHYYNHGPPPPINPTPPGSNDLSRSLGSTGGGVGGPGGHSSFLCHPMSPHSPPTNTPDIIGSCPSRLYLPPPPNSSCRNTSQSLHSSNTSYNQSSMWPHMGGSTVGSLSLPQFSSNHGTHKDSGLPPPPSAMDNSPIYNEDTVAKMKLQNSLQNYPAFPPHLYPQYGGSEYSTVGSTAFDMLAGFQKCRPISRSNSGKHHFLHKFFFSLT